MIEPGLAANQSWKFPNVRVVSYTVHTRSFALAFRFEKAKLERLLVSKADVEREWFHGRFAMRVKPHNEARRQSRNVYYGPNRICSPYQRTVDIHGWPFEPGISHGSSHRATVSHAASAPLYVRSRYLDRYGNHFVFPFFGLSQPRRTATALVTRILKLNGLTGMPPSK